MFRKIYSLSALILVSVYFLGSAQAGCNGSCEIDDGQDWIVNLDTHIWDETVEIKSLTVNPGASLKLENMTVRVKENVNIFDNTEWISSNITLLRNQGTNNVTIYEKLEIINSEVTIYVNMNDTANSNAANAKGFFLEHNGELIIRDLDNNNETTGDASIIKPQQVGQVQYSWQYAT